MQKTAEQRPDTAAVERLRQTLIAASASTAACVPAILAFHWCYPSPIVMFFAIFVALFFLPSNLLALRLIARGRVQACLLSLSIAHWAAALLILLLIPPLFAVGAIVAVLPVAYALPYAPGRSLPPIIFGCGGVIVLGAILGALGLPLPVEPMPERVVEIGRLTAVPLLIGLVLLSVWYSASRLRETLEQTRAANLALQESERSLERKVEARTAELVATQRELERANAAKRLFLATASHDLRQPLHALGLFVATLADRARDPDQRELVARIQSSTGTLAEMLDALLDISKLEAGQIAPQISDFPLGPLIERLATELAPQAERKGLALRAVSRELSVRSDPLLLRRILQNLVTNALRYTDQGKVLLGCRRRGERVRIEVWDSGRGIAPEQRERIFGEFQRVEPAGARTEALGLGLAIVDRLARLLGHDLDVASTPGRGSVFRVTVPLGKGAAPVQEPVATGGLEHARVVVIEDDVEVRDGMRRLLESWGCRVLACESTGQALASLRADAFRPEAILADYELADGTTGVEAIHAIRGDLGAAVPGLIVSASATPERAERTRESGLLLLGKPVAPVRLRAALLHLLEPRADPTRDA